MLVGEYLPSSASAPFRRYALRTLLTYDSQPPFRTFASHDPPSKLYSTFHDPHTSILLLTTRTIMRSFAPLTAFVLSATVLPTLAAPQ